MSTSSLQLQIRRRLWFLVSLAIVASLVSPAVSTTTTGKEEDRDAQVIKVAASCATKCRDLCTALPKSEDPDCDHRCDTISAAFNGSVKDPTALDPKTAFSAVQEMHMCYTGCSLRCNIPGGDSRSCKDKWRDGESK